MPTTAGLTEGAVFLLQPDQQRLLALDYQGRVRSVIQLDAVPKAVVPTPGGVSVFVFFEDSGLIEVYSASDFSQQQRIPTELAAIESLSFSPNGDRVYISGAAADQLGDQPEEQGTVIEYQHAMLELTQPRRVDDLPGSGRLVPNRRGTRLYRGGASRFYRIFSQTLQVIDEFPAGLTQPAFDSDYSEIWGRSPAGTATAVDARSGEVVYAGSQAVMPMTPVVTRSISYLAADGRSVLHFEPGSGDSPQRTELEYPAAVLVRGPGQTVWAVAENGRISEIAEQRVVGEWEIDPLRETTGIQGGAAARIQQDGSFACF